MIVREDKTRQEEQQVSSGGVVARSALIGAAQGLAESVVLYATSEKHTLANDWFLGVMIVFANTVGFAVAARYGINLLGVAIAGVAGMMIGGWFGVRLIGNYEYTVPTPRDDRVLRIIAKGKEREVELPGVPEKTVKRVPVGGAVGCLLGFGAGASLFGWFSGRRNEEPDLNQQEAE